jgi:hypothetical protein
MKRPRLRKWAKWACTLAAGVAVGAAVFSRFYSYRWHVVASDKSSQRATGLGEGLLWSAHLNGVMPQDATRSMLKRAEGWRWGLASDSPGSMWRGGLCCTRRGFGAQIGVSVMYPVLLTVAPAALLWYADRRRSGPYACKECGYDRRGLVGVGGADAKCPECGTVAAPAPTK